MYAVIRTGSKQYRVSLNDVLHIERVQAERGAAIQFDVLAIGEGDNLKIGTPLVAGAKVTGQVLAEGRGHKVIIYKWRHRKNYHRKRGHRQYFTEVRITEIAAAN